MHACVGVGVNIYAYINIHLSLTPKTKKMRTNPTSSRKKNRAENPLPKRFLQKQRRPRPRQQVGSSLARCSRLAPELVELKTDAENKKKKMLYFMKKKQKINLSFGGYLHNMISFPAGVFCQNVYSS